VELVHDHEADVGTGTFTQCHVGQDLCGCGDDRGVGIDRSVPGDHADVVGTEDLAQVKELLADERLDGRGVDTALAARERCRHRCRRDEALAGAGWSGEDDIRSGHELEDRLVLRGIERQSTAFDPLGYCRMDGVLG